MQRGGDVLTLAKITTPLNTESAAASPDGIHQAFMIVPNHEFLLRSGWYEIEVGELERGGWCIWRKDALVARSVGHGF